MVTVTVEVSACEACPHAIVNRGDPITGARYPDSWWCDYSMYWRLFISDPSKVHPRCPFLKKKEGAS